MDFAYHFQMPGGWRQWMASITDDTLAWWMAWVKVRGPIGGERTDFYASLLAMHASSSPFGGDEKKTTDDPQFRMWWDSRPPPPRPEAPQAKRRRTRPRRAPVSTY
jgi:hypothetical protein